jgi:enediyne biosynthesis protein E4
MKITMPRILTRREMLALTSATILSSPTLPSQEAGMATRGLAPAPRPKFSGKPFNAHFTDVAQSAGLHAPSICGAADHTRYLIETTGAGIAFLDYDNDGWLDIFVLSGTLFDSPAPHATNRLYKNNRDGTFTDVTEKAGLVRNGWAMGVTVGDYNSDGNEDIFVTYWGQNVLYRNNGDGTFTDVTKQAGLLRPVRWGTGCTFVDYDRDGHLDLFIANYVVFDPRTVPQSCNWKGVQVNCGPRGLGPESHLLFHNNGDGTFTDVTERSGIGSVTRSYGLTAVAADFDNDGWPDIYVACDSTPSLLFRNKHDGTFTEEGMERGVSLSSDGQEQAGMGIGVGDYDLTGNLDIVKTHFQGDMPGLYRNLGKGDFEEVTLRAGLGVETRFICWGTGFADLDNDGLPDVFTVAGGVYPEVERIFPEIPMNMPRMLFRNLGEGAFEELSEKAGPGIAIRQCSRGCAFGDFDNDGDLDILIMNRNAPPSLLRNDLTGSNHWLKIQLVGVKSNRSAIGARATLHYGTKQQAQEVLAQSSYLSVCDRRLHFGLGAATTANLEIRWPNGLTESISNLAADQLVVIREGAGVVSSQKFSTHHPNISNSTRRSPA